MLLELEDDELEDGELADDALEDDELDEEGLEEEELELEDDELGDEELLLGVDGEGGWGVVGLDALGHPVNTRQAQPSAAGNNSLRAHSLTL